MATEEIALSGTIRKPKASKNELRANRQKGIIPAIVYGAKKDPKSLWVSNKELEKAMRQAHSANVLFELTMEEAGFEEEKAAKTKKKPSSKTSSSETVLLKDIQRNVIDDTPIHVDFLRVDIHKEVEVAVAVHVTGESSGVKNQGGILEHILREIKVRCLPTAIPELITVDVSHLEIGQGLLVGDLKLPKGVELVTDASHVMVNVVAPARVEEPVVAAVTAETSAEPEVIAKGKKETAEAGGAPVVEGSKPGGTPTKGGPPSSEAHPKTETPKKKEN